MTELTDDQRAALALLREDAMNGGHFNAPQISLHYFRRLLEVLVPEAGSMEWRFGLLCERLHG